MTDIATETVLPPLQAIESPHDRLIDTVTAQQQEVIAGVESAGTATVAGIGVAHLIFTDFVRERMREDLETQRAILRCRTPDEVRAVGFAHLRTAVDQYGRQVARMYGLGTTLARHGLDRPRLIVRGA